MTSERGGSHCGFPTSLFQDRRERVLAGLGNGAMVLPAAPILLKGRDTELLYRQDSDLFYLTGFTESDSVLVLRGFAETSRAVRAVPSSVGRGARRSGRCAAR